MPGSKMTNKWKVAFLKKAYGFVVWSSAMAGIGAGNKKTRMKFTRVLKSLGSEGFPVRSAFRL